jgi:hypothetical protein
VLRPRLRRRRGRLSLQARTAREHGDLEVARRKARLGWILPVVMWVLNAVLMTVLWHVGVIALPQ